MPVLFHMDPLLAFIKISLYCDDLPIFSACVAKLVSFFKPDTVGCLKYYAHRINKSIRVTRPVIKPFSHDIQRVYLKEVQLVAIISNPW